jgi:hypothetical protein
LLGAGGGGVGDGMVVLGGAGEQGQTEAANWCTVMCVAECVVSSKQIGFGL